MKRSDALAALSRDHHQALVVAQQLRRAHADSAVAARDRFLSYWAQHGQRHFRLEEELLLPAYAAYGDAHHPVVLRALGDHVAIRQRADRLAREPRAQPPALHELGRQLATHVRMEERELFPLIERAMPTDKLIVLAEALERADAATAR